MQVLKEATLSISKFGREVRKLYILKIPCSQTYKQVRNIKRLPTIEPIDVKIDGRMSVNVNPLRGIDDPTTFHGFDYGLDGNITVDYDIR